MVQGCWYYNWNIIGEIEGVENETEGKGIEGFDPENEGVDPDNEGTENKVLHTYWKGHLLWNPSTINHNDGIDKWRSMGWNTFIVGSHEPQIVENPLSTS